MSARSLQKCTGLCYIQGVAEQSATGIGLPCMSAQALPRSAFFTPEIQFYGGLCGGSSERRPRAGKTNSVQPATLLIGLNGGSSQFQHEDSIMANSSHNISAQSTHQATLLEIRDQCRQMAFDLSFAISRLKEIGKPDAARRLQSASIILSGVADDLQISTKGGT